MALFSTPFEDVKPEEILQEGSYTLRVQSTEMKTAQSGREYLLVIFVADDYPQAPAIFHNVNSILPQDDDRLRQIFSRMAKTFFDTFGQDFQDPDPTALIGESCGALVVCETDNNGIVRNKVKKFL